MTVVAVAVLVGMDEVDAEVVGEREGIPLRGGQLDVLLVMVEQLRQFAQLGYVGLGQEAAQQ